MFWVYSVGLVEARFWIRVRASTGGRVRVRFWIRVELV